MRPVQRVLVLVAALLLATAARAGELTPEGKQLAKALDALHVDSLWLKGKYVKWESGEALPKEVTDNKSHTHCSAFVAAAAKRLGVYVQRPKSKDDPAGVTPHKTTLLANAQFDWLQSDEARKLGWQPVSTPLDAQRLANQGKLVIAAFKEADPKRAGHIAIVRPHVGRTEQQLEADGPQIIQAGSTNFTSATLRQGFSHHPLAWDKARGVRFFVNDGVKLP